MAVLIDAHTHMDRYEDELEGALRQIEERGIFTVTNSMNVASYERNLGIARKCGLVVPIFGVHPWNAGGYAGRIDSLKGYIEQSPMLGEIGLDHHFVRHSKRYPDQRKVLEFFLAAAADQNKIVNLHTKGAEGEIVEMLDTYGIRRAIVHWYSGPLEILHQMASRGFYFTIGVEVMHSDHIKSVALAIPEDRLLTETDNPGGLKWLAGTIGMPLALEDVTRTVADIRHTTPEAITKTVHTNFLRLAGDDPWLPGHLSD